MSDKEWKEAKIVKKMHFGAVYCMKTNCEAGIFNEKALRQEEI